MSLDVTFGTSGTGPAPPSPSGLAGAAGAKPTASDLATLFAALLANAAPPPSAPPGKAATPAASPPTEEPSREPSRSPDEPPNDAPNPPAAAPNAPDAALATLLMALTAPPTTIQTIPDKPLPPTSPAADRVGDATEITRQTTQEAMDTVPAPASSALSAKKDDTADGELLPLSLNLAAAQAVAMPVALPSATAFTPAASGNVMLPTASALSAPTLVETSAPMQAVAAPATPATSAEGPPRSVSDLSGVPDRAARSSAFALTAPAIPVSVKSQTVVVLGAPAMAVPVAASTPSTPPTAVSLNDIRPDALRVSTPAPPVTPGISLLTTADTQTVPPVQTTVQAGSASQAASPSIAAVLTLAQTVLQNKPQPANNTGMPTPKANEMTAKPTGTAYAAGQAPEPIVPLVSKPLGQPTQAKPTANASGAALSSVGSVSVSGTASQDTNGEEPSEAAKAPETDLTEMPAVLTTPLQTAPASQSAPPTLSPADRAGVMQQISDGAQQISQRPDPNGVREINLQLHPHDWGQIKLSVRMTPTVNADGAAGTTVIAHIVADNPAVKTALETHTAELRQTLQDAGMKLDRLSVTVQAPDSGAQSGTAGQEQRPFTQDSGAWTGQGTAAPNSDASAAGQSGGSGFGSAFSSNFGDGRGGQTRHQPPSSPVPAWTEDTETTNTPNSSTRLPMGRWDSRA